jgi:hypothetical protein
MSTASLLVQAHTVTITGCCDPCSSPVSQLDKEFFDRRLINPLGDNPLQIDFHLKPNALPDVGVVDSSPVKTFLYFFNAFSASKISLRGLFNSSISSFLQVIAPNHFGCLPHLDDLSVSFSYLSRGIDWRCLYAQPNVSGTPNDIWG